MKYCRLVPRLANGYKGRNVFEGKNVNKLRVYAFDDDAIVVEANWDSAGKPTNREHYSFIDPELETMDGGFYWLNREDVEIVHVEDNEDALFALRSDGEQW